MPVVRRAAPARTTIQTGRPVNGRLRVAAAPKTPPAPPPFALPEATAPATSPVVVPPVSSVVVPPVSSVVVPPTLPPCSSSTVKKFLDLRHSFSLPFGRALFQ